MRSLGVFGGSFNPVHQAHLIVAERVREALSLDRVLFVPAARQPLKQTEELAPGADRLQMLRLALAGNPAFEASPLELERGGPSYTVDTLSELRRREPEVALYVVLGTDAFRQVDRWRRIDEVLRVARLVVVPRGGPAGETAEQSTGSAAAAGHLTVDVPALGISASEIRARVARNASIRYLVPEAVRAYIEERGLYH